MRHWIVVILLVAALSSAAQVPSVRVNVEEDVYKFTNPNNGSGPLWDYGSSNIVRAGNDVYISQMETGEGIPPLSNTRWRLLKRTENGWKCVAEAEKFNQREPCPMAVMGGTVFMSVNDSTQPAGTKYGNCEPCVLKFSAANDGVSQSRLVPAWKTPHTFTDHSYRGFAADPQSGHVVMLNIDAKTSEQNACLMTASGETLGCASVSFPIRACYPQVALRDKAVHVLAVGDIVEPVAEWKTYKHEQTKQDWDYVFRRLFYTSTPDVTASEFAAPLEIANVDETGGHIGNQDLWIGPEGEAYILYSARDVASALLRDKFFPGKSIVGSLHLAVVKNGQVVSRRVLHAGSETAEAGCARLHVAANGTVYALLYMSGKDAGNKLIQIYPAVDNPPLIDVPAKKPMPGFCLAGTRGGNKPGNVIDALGQYSGDAMGYMQIVIE